MIDLSGLVRHTILCIEFGNVAFFNTSTVECCGGLAYESCLPVKDFPTNVTILGFHMTSRQPCLCP